MCSIVFRNGRCTESVFFAYSVQATCPHLGIWYSTMVSNHDTMVSNRGIKAWYQTIVSNQIGVSKHELKYPPKAGFHVYVVSLRHRAGCWDRGGEEWEVWLD